jgi:hypothetical protein
MGSSESIWKAPGVELRIRMEDRRSHPSYSGNSCVVGVPMNFVVGLINRLRAHARQCVETVAALPPAENLSPLVDGGLSTEKENL